MNAIKLLKNTNAHCLELKKELSKQCNSEFVEKLEQNEENLNNDRIKTRSHSSKINESIKMLIEKETYVGRWKLMKELEDREEREDV